MLYVSSKRMILITCKEEESSLKVALRVILSGSSYLLTTSYTLPISPSIDLKLLDIKIFEVLTQKIIPLFNNNF
jgi:hypothetical protein